MASVELSAQEFAAWAGSQPASKRYNFFSNEACALAQYLSARGTPADFVGGFYWSAEGVDHRIPGCIGDALIQHPHTFGALSRRLHDLAS